MNSLAAKVILFVWFIISHTVLFLVGMITEGSLAGRTKGWTRQQFTNLSIVTSLTILGTVGLAAIQTFFPVVPPSVFRWCLMVYAVEMLAYFILVSFAAENLPDAMDDPLCMLIPFVLLWPYSAASGAMEQNEGRGALWVLFSIGAIVSLWLLSRAACGILDIQYPTLLLGNIKWWCGLIAYGVGWIGMFVVFVATYRDPSLS
ncbi:MAG: hypothetical protein HN964_04810 [Candidatus Jacksonbacteria bacterium]|jgi:hypothetical protein|nr:hypothetical protein [Candidatus Jacksonbacteria bacterium]